MPDEQGEHQRTPSTPVLSLPSIAAPDSVHVSKTSHAAGHPSATNGVRWGADSISKRTAVQGNVKPRLRCSTAQSFPRTLIESAFDSLKLLVADGGQMASLDLALPLWAFGVLVADPLSRRTGDGEVEVALITMSISARSANSQSLSQKSVWTSAYTRNSACTISGIVCQASPLATRHWSAKSVLRWIKVTPH